MKIKYWIVIVMLGGAGIFFAGNLYSGSQNKHKAAFSETVRPIQAKTPGLKACGEEAGIKGDPDSMGEQALRRYMKTCSGILLANESFPALDSTIAFLRNNKIRTPSGLWLQSLFYAGIEEYLGNVTTETGFMQTEESLQHWITASSNPDTAHLAMSALMLHKAFLYRGSGYAVDVSEENFKLFYQQISRTKKYLLEHEGIAARDPEWFTQMLVITRVEENSDEKTHRDYFDKAVKLYPDYYPVIFTASTMYLPKWGGSQESYDEFARYAAEKAGADNSKSVYARIYWSDICSKCGDRDLPDWREQWGDLQSGFDQIIGQYPDQWNINSYAHIACLAYDQDKTLELMRKIKDEPIPEAWNDEQFTYDYCATWSGLNEGVK